MCIRVPTCLKEDVLGTVLLFPINEVPSVLERLTAEFEMGSGGPTPPEAPRTSPSRNVVVMCHSSCMLSYSLLSMLTNWGSVA